MSREQLLALTKDVDRLLLAGSTVAAGDEGLRRREKVLHELAPQVPALAPVAEAVKRVTGARPSEAAPALLDLLMLTQQLRFSLAPAGVEGTAEPVNPSGPWATRAPVHDVALLREALTGTGSGRLELLKDAIQRKTIADLRLVGPLLQALGDGYDELADLVAEEALPAFGPAVLPDLRRGLNLKGKTVDARRLAAICKIDPKGGAEFCRVALAEGTLPVRVRAIRCLAELDPAAAERTALELLAQKVPAELCSAALSALQGSRTDAALDVLAQTLARGGSADGHTACAVLQKLPHPAATDRLVRELEAAVARVDEARSTKGKRKGKGKANEDEVEPLAKRVGLILTALAGRGDRQAARALLPLLEHALADLRERAAETLTLLGDPEGLAAAVALVDDPKVWHTGVRAAWQLPLRERYDRLAPLCQDLSHTRKPRRERSEFVLRLFEEEATDQVRKPRTDWDRRWAKLLLDHLEGPNRSGVAIALEVVQGVKAVPALMRVLPASVKKDECGVVEALGRLRAHAAVGLMIDLIPGQPAHHYCIHDALRLIGDRSAVPLLEELLHKTTDPYRQRQIEQVIEHLQTQQ